MAAKSKTTTPAHDAPADASRHSGTTPTPKQASQARRLRRDVDRRTLLLGLAVLAAIAAWLTLGPGIELKYAGGDNREIAAAFLGLLVLGIAAFGANWRDWL